MAARRRSTSTTSSTSTPSSVVQIADKKNIYITGARASGKTTFLAALLSITQYSKNKNHRGRIIVKPISNDATSLQNENKYNWEGGIPFKPTNFGNNLSDLKDYEFKIEQSKRFFFNSSFNQPITLKAKDYGGELFQDILEYPLPSKIEPYIKDCLLNANGLVIMLPDFCLQDQGAKIQVVEDVDTFYKSVLLKLFSDFPESRIIFPNEEDRAKAQKNLRKLRIAIVMSKCERGELWTRRWEPERDLFAVHLPQTRELLRETLNFSKNQLRFFALSSFGVLSSRDPRPNRVNLGVKLADGAIIDPNNQDKWLPFGLLNPIYWLQSGKTSSDPSF